MVNSDEGARDEYARLSCSSIDAADHDRLCGARCSAEYRGRDGAATGGTKGEDRRACAAAHNCRDDGRTHDNGGPVGTAALAATNVKVAFPAEVNVYLVDTGTREVCDTFSFGGRDFRTECRTEPLRVRAEKPALRGICITRYGNRTCY